MPIGDELELAQRRKLTLVGVPGQELPHILEVARHGGRGEISQLQAGPEAAQPGGGERRRRYRYFPQCNPRR